MTESSGSPFTIRETFSPITVSAPEGVFPAGSTLSVKKVPVLEQRRVDAAIEEVREADVNVAASYTFDIKVIGPDGQEVQPTDGSLVSVSFALNEVGDENLQTNVYHVSEDTATRQLEAESLEVTEEISATPGEMGVATVETEGFSYYTVEFTYNTLQYVLEGGESVALSEILNKVGLDENAVVSNVEVSNSSLFTATENNGVWTVNSLQPFSTTEWMKVTIGEVTYEIQVTDDNNTTTVEVSTWEALVTNLEDNVEKTIKITVPSRYGMKSQRIRTDISECMKCS